MTSPPHHQGHQRDPKNRPWNRADANCDRQATLAMARLPNTPRPPKLAARIPSVRAEAVAKRPPAPAPPKRATPKERAPTPTPPKRATPKERAPPKPPPRAAKPPWPPKPPPCPPKPPRASASSVKSGTARSNIAAVQTPAIDTGRLTDEARAGAEAQPRPRYHGWAGCCAAVG